VVGGEQPVGEADGLKWGGLHGASR
jgi:hypothetical protein